MSTQKRPNLTGTQLKYIAIITMVIDHIGAFIIYPTGLEHTNSNELAILYLILRAVGRLAFPIFAFLLVEGSIHTKNTKQYAINLGLFALLSEIPFNLAYSGNLLNHTHQNIFFTLFIGLITIELFKYHEKDKILRWGFPIVGAIIASLIKADYGAVGIIVIFIFYYLHDNTLYKNVLISPFLLSQTTALLSLIPIYLYNGKRGKHQNKLFFYIFYPAHLILLYLIRIIF